MDFLFFHELGPLDEIWGTTPVPYPPLPLIDFGGHSKLSTKPFFRVFFLSPDVCLAARLEVHAEVDGVEEVLAVAVHQAGREGECALTPSSGRGPPSVAD